MTKRAQNVFTRYRELEDRLLHLRANVQLEDPDGADEILDEMEELWGKLTADERVLLNSEPSQTWPDAAKRETPL